MTEQPKSKRGRFQRWRERRRASAERAGDIQRRSKQGRASEFERNKRTSGSGGYVGPGMPGGM
jgi:hypothetical protein